MKKFLLVIIVIGLSFNPAYSEFSLKVGGGLTYVSAGDINRAALSSNDLMKDFAASYSGSFVTFHTGADFGLELLFGLNKRTSLGLGAGYFRMDYDSQASYTDGTSISQENSGSISVIPITLSLHNSFPLVPKVNFFLTTGLGYYATRFCFDVYYDKDYGALGEESYDYTFKSGRGAFGFHGGAGIEIEMGKSLSLVVEFIGRYAKASDFQGDWTVVDEINGTIVTDNGSDHYFYYYEFVIQGRRYSQLWFDRTPPEDVDLSRKGGVNLSGFSAIFGIRYRFGSK